MEAEARHVTQHLASMPGLAHAVVTRKVAREIIQSCGGQMMLQGYLYEVTTKSAGAGLLRISTRRWKEGT